jgi:hypothetical protein
MELGSSREVFREEIFAEIPPLPAASDCKSLVRGGLIAVGFGRKCNCL